MSEASPTLDSGAPPVESDEEKPRRRWPSVVRAVVGLCLYVFSIGPMFWYWYEAENMGGNFLIRAFYMPLRLLCAIPIVQDWLNQYINWWIA